MNDPLTHFLKDVLAGMPRSQPDAHWQERTHERLMRELSQQHHPGDGRSARSGRSVLSMRWLIGTAGAAAAAVILWLGLPYFNTPSFAGVQRQIREARTLRCLSTVALERDGQRQVVSTAQSWADQDLGVRLDINVLGQPFVEVWLPAMGRPILVDHIHRQVTPIDLPSSLNPADILWFDPTTLIYRLGQTLGPITPIPASQGSGEVGRGYRIAPQSVQLPSNAAIELWVNPRTQLPQRLTIRLPLGDRTLDWTIDHFTWNQPIPVSNLMFATPKGYRQMPALTVPRPDKGTLIRTLRRYAKLEAGRFPPSTMPTWQALERLFVMVLAPAPLRKQLPAPLNTPKGQREAIGDAIAAGIFYFELNEQGRQPIYHGNGVRLGDSTPLLSWTEKDGRVETISGNLKTKASQP